MMSLRVAPRRHEAVSWLAGDCFVGKRLPELVEGNILLAMTKVEQESGRQK